MICLCPSINKTQIGNVVVPIPYPVQQSLAKAKKVSRNVRFNRDQAFTSASHTRKVTGDAPGRLKGIISNTTSAQAAPKQHSHNIRINKKWLVRCGDRFTMNKNNTQGTLVCSPPPAGPAISDDGRIEAADDATPDTGLLAEAHDYHPGHLAEYEGHIRQTFAESQKNWRDFVSLWRSDPVGALVQQARKTQQALKETLANIADDAGQWATRQANQYTNWWHTHGQKAWQDAGLGTIANAAATLAPIALGTASDVINPARKINAIGKIGKAVSTGKSGGKGGGGGNKKKKKNKEPEIAKQKLAGHIPGTPQHTNRVKQGKATSTFFDKNSAERLTREAFNKGKIVPGRKNVREYNFGKPVGTGPNGGIQTRVRAHQDSKGRIHGHPAGPEIF